MWKAEDQRGQSVVVLYTIHSSHEHPLQTLKSSLSGFARQLYTLIFNMNTNKAIAAQIPVDAGQLSTAVAPAAATPQGESELKEAVASVS